MNQVRIVTVIFICAVSAFITACGLFFPPRQGEKINERWEATNNTFRIRVTAYAEENGGFVAGAYYVFESALVGANNWNHIMTFRHDDPVPIQREQVRFISDQIGYAFMIYKFAVTTDSGRTWSVWNIVEDFPDWQNNRAAIKDVKIALDGTGTMVLTPFANQSKVIELYTEDFGKQWRPKQ